MSQLRAGELLDHYRIEDLVARSGMASIFRATDTRNARQVAIKVPHPEMEAEPVLYDRFQREAEIGKIMDHPGVMKVFNGETRSRIYMVMEWVEGRLLRHIIHEQKKLPADRARRIAINTSSSSTGFSSRKRRWTFRMPASRRRRVEGEDLTASWATNAATVSGEAGNALQPTCWHHRSNSAKSAR